MPEAYARFVERLRALDSSTPVAVTVVVGGAAPTAAGGGASSECGSTMGPADC